MRRFPAQSEFVRTSNRSSPVFCFPRPKDQAHFFLVLFWACGLHIHLSSSGKVVSVPVAGNPLGYGMSIDLPVHVRTAGIGKVTPQRLSQTVAVVHLLILVSQFVGIPLRIWLSLRRRRGRFKECLLLGWVGLVLPLPGISAGLSRAGALGVGAGLVAAVLPVVVPGCCKVLVVSAPGLGVASMWLMSPVLSARL